MSWFGLKYYGELTSKYFQVRWRVEIAEREYSGSSKQMTLLQDNPLSVAWEKSGDEFFEPVKGSEATIQILCTDDFEYMDLYTSDPRKFRVTIYRNSQTFWRGFVAAELYSETFNAPPYPMSIKAIDGFSLLANVPLASVYPTSGLRSLYYILNSIIGVLELGMSIEEWIGIYAQGATQSGSSLSGVYLNISMLYKVKPDITCMEVLEMILRPLGAQIFQAGGEINIRRIASLAQSYRPQSFYSLQNQSYSTSNDVTMAMDSAAFEAANFSVSQVVDLWDNSCMPDEMTLEITPGCSAINVEVEDNSIENIFDNVDLYSHQYWVGSRRYFFAYSDTLGKNITYLDRQMAFEQEQWFALVQSVVMRHPAYDEAGYIEHTGINVSATDEPYKLSVSAKYEVNRTWKDNNHVVESFEADGIKFGIVLKAAGKTYYLHKRLPVESETSYESENIYAFSEGENDLSYSSISGGDSPFEIIIDGFPLDGVLCPYVYQNLNKDTVTRPSFVTQMLKFEKFELSLLNDASNKINTNIAYNVNFANSNLLEIKLPISEAKDIANWSLTNPLSFVNYQGQALRNFNDGVNIGSLINSVAQTALWLKNKPRKALQGGLFTSRYLDLNSLIEDDKFLDVVYHINSLDVSALNDTYNVELKELPPFQELAQNKGLFRYSQTVEGTIFAKAVKGENGVWYGLTSDNVYYRQFSANGTSSSWYIDSDKYVFESYLGATTVNTKFKRLRAWNKDGDIQDEIPLYSSEFTNFQLSDYPCAIRLEANINFFGKLFIDNVNIGSSLWDAKASLLELRKPEYEKYYGGFLTAPTFGFDLPTSYVKAFGNGSAFAVNHHFSYGIDGKSQTKVRYNPIIYDPRVSPTSYLFNPEGTAPSFNDLYKQPEKYDAEAYPPAESCEIMSITDDFVCYNTMSQFIIAARPTLQTYEYMRIESYVVEAADQQGNQFAWAIDGKVYIWDSQTQALIYYTLPSSATKVINVFFVASEIVAVTETKIYRQPL